METTEITEDLKREVLESLDTVELYQEIQTRNNISEGAQAAADKAKEEGFEPMFIIVAGQQFVYRPMSRKEWRQHLKKQNVAIKAAEEDQTAIFEVQEDAKESLVEFALIYQESKVMPAGAVEILSDAILIESGFGPPDTEPIRL
jgi:hypothetical protein